jgi:very-short-patch-repair endonuclease
VARHQHGRIASRQLRAIQVSRTSVAWLIERGRLFACLRGVFRVGHYWPAARFALEVDSHGFHSSRYRFERDRRKDNQLRRAGIEVMRIVRRELTDRSHGIIADVTRELTKRGL